MATETAKTHDEARIRQLIERIAVADTSRIMNTERVIAKEVLIESDAATVWQVLTDAAYIVDWLGVHVLSDWNAGGPLVFLCDRNGRPFPDKSTILKLDSEKVFSYSFWSEVSGLPDRPENYSVITFWLINKGEATSLALNHDHLPMKTMVEHVARHWEQTLMTIKELAEGKRTPAPAKGRSRLPAAQAGRMSCTQVQCVDDLDAHG